MKPTIATAAPLLSLVLFQISPAHDIWLASDPFVYEPGRPMTLHLHVGHEFESEQKVSFSRQAIKRFELMTPNGIVDLLQELPSVSRPVVRRRLDFGGMGLIAMERDFSYIELSDDKFSEYLEHEALSHITQLRQKRGPRPTERERYWRTIQSLIQVGDGHWSRQIEDADLRFLSGLENVRALDLSGSQVSNEGLVRLAKLNNLRTLNLERTRVTDQGLGSLRDLTQLKNLNVGGTAVTKAGTEQLDGLRDLQVSFASTTSNQTMAPMLMLPPMLEIRLLQNPYLLNPGDELEAKILFRGEPLPDKAVWAFRQGRRKITRLKSETDEHGIARFKLAAAGVWLIRLVHMQPCPLDDVDWESYWGAYTFQLD